MAEEIKKTEAAEEAAPAEEKKPAKKAPRKTTAKKAVKKEEEKKEPEIPEYNTRPTIIKDYRIIKYVIVTEETQRLQQEQNTIVFAVDRKATKTEIKAAVQAIFRAKVLSVNTINPQAKTKRVGRYSGKLPLYKKAIVKFDSSYDLGKIANALASEETKANEEAK